MPLQLSDPTTELPKRVIWDPAIAEDAVEALGKVARLKAEGFTIREESEGEVVLYPPPANDPDRVLLRVLDDNGDSRLVWNRKNQAEVAEAKEKFNSYLARGYKAYVCRLDGSKGSKVESFDELMEELIMVEDKQAMMLPRTAAG